MVAAVQAMQASEMPPTAAELEACAQQQAAYTALMAKWAALKAKINGPAAGASRGQEVRRAPHTDPRPYTEPRPQGSGLAGNPNPLHETAY